MTTYLALLRSACCAAAVIVAGRTTHHYECVHCLSACDLRQHGNTARCPLCCEHGIRLTRECGWCRNDDGEPYQGPSGDEPQWICQHGIGRDLRQDGETDG